MNFENEGLTTGFGGAQLNEREVIDRLTGCKLIPETTFKRAYNE